MHVVVVGFVLVAERSDWLKTTTLPSSRLCPWIKRRRNLADVWFGNYKIAFSCTLSIILLGERRACTNDVSLSARVCVEGGGAAQTLGQPQDDQWCHLYLAPKRLYYREPFLICSVLAVRDILLANFELSALSCEKNQLVRQIQTGLPSSKCKNAKGKQGHSSSVKGSYEVLLLTWKNCNYIL